MVTKNVAAKNDLATLALAKALAEGDAKSVAAAMKAGADAEGFWIDGRTRLRSLAGVWGTATAVKAIKALLSPAAMKVLPPMKSDESLWTKRFVEFVARRGYGFHGCTKLQNGSNGSELSGLASAKAALGMISTKWSRGLEDAHCIDLADGKSSGWRLWFKPTFNLDRRITGFWISFTVDATGWQLVEEFETEKAAQNDDAWPSPTSKYAISQRDWEGEMIVLRSFSGVSCNMERLIKCLRAGGNPFTKLGREPLGYRNGYINGGTAETKAFMDAFLEALGPREGWHFRIAPLLTDEGIRAIKSKIDMGTSTPAAKTPKKSLKDRKDIM